MRYRPFLIVGVLLGGATALAAEDPQVGGSGMQVKVFTVRNGDATSLAEMLRLALGQGSSGVRPLQIVAELRTNSIVAVGAASDLEVIRGLLARLEEPASNRLRPITQQPASKRDSAPAPSGAANWKQLAAMQSFSMKPPGQDVNEAEARLESAKAELDRQESLRNQRSATFSFSELARARLAVRSAEEQLKQVPKRPSDPWKTGIKP